MRGAWHPDPGFGCHAPSGYYGPVCSRSGVDHLETSHSQA